MTSVLRFCYFYIYKSELGWTLGVLGVKERVARECESEGRGKHKHKNDCCT